MAKIMKVCPKCGSTAITLLALCDWSLRKGEYEIIDLMDGEVTCSYCGAEDVKPAEREATEEELKAMDPSPLQKFADELSIDLNNYINTLSWSNGAPKFSDSDIQYGCMLFGKLQLLRSVDPDLHFNDPGLRWEQIDFNLFK